MKQQRWVGKDNAHPDIKKEPLCQPRLFIDKRQKSFNVRVEKSASLRLPVKIR
jgi:hypothetical protein